MMLEPLSGFLVAACPDCRRDVLTARDLGPGGELVSACLHCDRAVEPHTLRAANPEELDALGYDVPGLAPQGTSRGCRDGKCGVQQPDA